MNKLLVIFIALQLSACTMFRGSEFDIEDIPLKPVSYLDLDRSMGRWYMIANIPYYAERGNVGVYVDYRRREDGLIEDRYTARDAFDQPTFTKKGGIEVLNPTNQAEGRITFFPFPGQDYTVLYVDEHYQYTMIGHPSRNYCWLFAREPHMPDEVYAKMRQILKDNLFDVSRVLKIPQRLEQIGAPGFQ